MERERVVAIEVGEADGPGSGYVIAPRLMLASAHVVPEPGCRRLPRRRRCGPSGQRSSCGTPRRVGGGRSTCDWLSGWISTRVPRPSLLRRAVKQRATFSRRMVR